MTTGYPRSVYLLVYYIPMPTYFVRTMMPDTELSQELICLIYLDV